MKKFLNGIFALLKIISWLWIALFTIIMFTVKFTNGEYNLGARLFVIVIINVIPAIFLVWRFKADKEIRFEKQKLKLERKKEEQAIKNQLSALEKKEIIETEKQDKEQQGTENINFDKSEKERIITAIEPIVKSTLKAPLTAVMCTPDELNIVNKGNNIYEVLGSVDSQNSYGAMIKTPVKVKVKYENNEWQVLSGGTVNTVGVQMASYWMAGIIFTILSMGVFYFIFKLIYKL